MVVPVTATPLARATDIPTIIILTPTDSAIRLGSTVTIGPIGDSGGHPVISSMVITSIVIDLT
jgi:hypothetical protein